jgi:hypothetical protein
LLLVRFEATASRPLAPRKVAWIIADADASMDSDLNTSEGLSVALAARPGLVAADLLWRGLRPGSSPLRSRRGEL